MPNPKRRTAAKRDTNNRSRYKGDTATLDGVGTGKPRRSPTLVLVEKRLYYRGKPVITQQSLIDRDLPADLAIQRSGDRVVGKRITMKKWAEKFAAKKEDELNIEILEAAANKGFREAAENTMAVMGYNVIAEDGWVVKVYPGGEREKIKQIAKVDRVIKTPGR